MKQSVIGILAHVDAGKTTLSEGILYTAGKIRRAGRVDHGDAYLDNNAIERERGITVFSKQATFEYNNTDFTLLDTPGHIDFAAEAERTLQVLDFAILVISGTDGVQAHTETLWQMLKRHNLPVFIFVNKMDLPGTDVSLIMKDLDKKFDGGCVDFSSGASNEFYDQLAMCDERLMEDFLHKEKVSDDLISWAIQKRKVFPCFFGSALRLDGVDMLLSGIDRFAPVHKYPEDFGAFVFKISDDGKGNRLAHMKITGGCLNVKDSPIENSNQKINEIRVYSGEKHTNISKATAGMVCAVTGLSDIGAGCGLGYMKDEKAKELSTEPIFAYDVKINDGTDLNTVLNCLKKLEEEETQLHVTSKEDGRISIRLMGEVQLEIIKRVVSDRFNINIDLEKGSVIYRETIAEKVEGVGHYEPLRHYAEVHLLLEPLPRGSGVRYALKCPDEMLDKAKQRLVLTHLLEREHKGVLTGSPITDIRITLIAGKAHIKHTEGGDFRQATYRAVRQGLMRAKNVLLEPWYEFTLTLPGIYTGKAMTDIDYMGGTLQPPKSDGDDAVIVGFAPASKIGDYGKEVVAYTKGKGRLTCKFSGYEECAEKAEVIEKIGYDPESDTENTGDSVFCSHGAGMNVKWNEVFNHMHLPAAELDTPKTVRASVKRQNNIFADEAELIKIFEQTYGKIKRRDDAEERSFKKASSAENLYVKDVRHTPRNADKTKKEKYVLIDGYNIIHAWKDLKEYADDDLDMARSILINRMCALRAVRDINVIVVFDAYKVKGGKENIETINNVSVVYTKEAETADSYIEKATGLLKGKGDVKVVTSDYMEQLIILGNGAYRITPEELLKDVEDAEEEIQEFLNRDI